MLTWRASMATPRIIGTRFERVVEAGGIATAHQSRSFPVTNSDLDSNRHKKEKRQRGNNDGKKAAHGLKHSRLL